MTGFVALVFVVVYAGMILGSLPFLQIDRTGVALLGAIALVAAGELTPEQAARSVHLPTILLLFSFMVLSAQMRLAGFYDWVTLRVAALPIGPAALLACVIAIAAALSAVFSNDVVCLAIAPVLASACARRGLAPVPFLLALACAANIGSAATLIGNPQNMLIGSVLELSFARYSATAFLPVLLSLALLWALLARAMPAADAGSGRDTAAARGTSTGHGGDFATGIPLDRWQAAKGLIVAAALVAVFLTGHWPREVAALTGAGILLLNRRLHSTAMLGLVDWELLVLFIGLFVVNHGFEQTGIASSALHDAASAGLHLDHAGPLMVATLLLSNLVSNVPAVMLLLPSAHGPDEGALLALISTFAGNLFIVGSLANIIVVDAARRAGIVIDWRIHARVGIPVTLASLAVAALSFLLRHAAS